MYCVIFNAFYTLYHMHFYYMHCILCIVFFALCHMLYIYALFPIHCILCIVIISIYISTILRVFELTLKLVGHRLTDRLTDRQTDWGKKIGGPPAPGRSIFLVCLVCTDKISTSVDGS